MSSATEWLAKATEDGVVRFRVGRRGDDVVAEWIDYATLVASRDGARWELTFAADLPEVQREKLRRGAVRVLLAQLRGELALHGSAVDIGGRALVFVGGSGAGKSTVAAALCARGAALVADDAVTIRIQKADVMIEPTEGLHWLDTTSCSALALARAVVEDAKMPVAAPRVSDRPLPVAGLVELAWSDGAVSLDETTSIDAFAHVLPHVGRLLIDSPDGHRRELDQLIQLFTIAPLYILARPRDFRHLADTVERLMRLASRGAEQR